MPLLGCIPSKMMIRASNLIAETERITVSSGQFASNVDRDRSKFTVTMADGTTHVAERLLVAAGRQTFLRELGVGHLGLDPSAPFLSVDDHMRVTDGVWAVGDIAGDGLFTHLAIRQAVIAADDIAGKEKEVEPLNLAALSSVTFTDPEVGAVGMTEAEARHAGLDVAVAYKPVAHTARGWLHSSGNEGFVKLVVDRARDVLVGATSMGPHGGEVLGLLALAVHAEIPVTTLRSMIYAYPTFHKGIEDALNELA